MWSENDQPGMSVWQPSIYRIEPAIYSIKRPFSDRLRHDLDWTLVMGLPISQ